MKFDDKITLPPAKIGAHIGLLGGSFDPPHVCHQLLALSFLALEPIDELWVIPCGDHAFKGNLSDFRHRMAMCEIAFRRINNVTVLDLENRLPTPSYTIETINFILEKRPDLSIHLCIGSDLVDGFSQWRRAEEVAKKAAIVIIERSSYPVRELPEILSKARIHRGYALPDINSTNQRDALKTDAATMTQPLLDREVMQYIEAQRIYKKP